MPYPHLTIRPHLRPAEVKRRYLACDDPVERSRWQALWLLYRPDDPLTAEQVSRVMARSSDWVRRTARRYNAEGPFALGDRRRGNGRKPLLQRRQQQSLLRALEKAPPDGGLWNGPKVAQWMENKTKRTISNVTGWHYLKRLGFTLHVPRPRHTDAATPEEQKQFRKNFTPYPLITA